MNNIFKKNIEALKNRYPDLAEKLDKIKENSNYLLYNDKSTGLYNLFSIKNDKFYYKNNPLKDVEEQISILKLKNTRIALFLGIGLGYELAFYLSKEAKKQITEYIFVVEKELEIFKLAMKTTDLSNIINNEKIIFIVDRNIEQVFEIFFQYFKKTEVLILSKTIKPVYHHSSILFNKEYYTSCMKKVNESVIYSLDYYGNSPSDSLLGIENMFKNINEIIKNPGINLLKDIFKNKPAIVVSSGPSLNKNKHLLKDLEDKAVIIAADSALKVLLSQDTKPHFVTMLERDYGMHELLEGVKYEEVKDIYFSGCPVIDKKNYDVYPGPRIIVYRNFNHFKWLEVEKGILDIKHSAGNMSFKIAEYLGCNPIILIGQDLAYGEDGTTHVKGMPLGDNVEEEKVFESMEVLGNSGKMIKTHKVWYNFLKSYEIDVANFRGKCINSTEGGAYINGTEIIPFSNAVDRYINNKIYPLDLIKKNISNFLKEEIKSDFVKVLNKINITIEDMNYIIDSCVEGINYYEKNANFIYKIIETNIIGNNSNKLLKVNCEFDLLRKKVIGKKHTFEMFFMHVIQSYFINFEIELLAIPNKHSDKYIALTHQISRLNNWFITIHDVAKICLNLLISAKNDIENI